MNVIKKKPDCKAILFDLDGTLLDTLGDLAAAANTALERAGFAPHPIEAYRRFVGDGARTLITRALPKTDRRNRTIAACLDLYLNAYEQGWDRATRPYPGIASLLTTLAEWGMPLAVVTNKPDRFAGAMVDRYFPKATFDPVLGQRRGVAKKPDPQIALKAASKIGVAPEQCILVGDSDTDMHTARNARMMAVGVAWGFRSITELENAKAECILHHPRELLQIIRE